MMSLFHSLLFKSLRRTCFLGLLGLAVLLLTTGFRKSQVLSGEAIMQSVKQAHVADTELELIQMVIVDGRGNAQTRKLLSAIQTSGDGNARYLLRFLEPENIAGVTLLTLEIGSGEVSQYLYLPAVGQARKVTGNARSSSFMGSDFTFEDLRKEMPSEHRYHRLLDDEVEGSDTYVVMSAPASVDIFNATGYEHRLLYVHKKTFDILKIEFYEAGSTAPMKTFQGYDFEGAEVDGPAKRPGRVVMNNHDKGTTSILTLLKSRLDVELPESIFDPAQLGEFSEAELAELMALFEAPAKES
jgi:hypothetical protein